MPAGPKFKHRTQDVLIETDRFLEMEDFDTPSSAVMAQNKAIFYLNQGDSKSHEFYSLVSLVCDIRHRYSEDAWSRFAKSVLANDEVTFPDITGLTDKDLDDELPF